MKKLKQKITTSDLRKVKSLGRGFKKKCEGMCGGRYFTAYRKNAKYCSQCQKFIKDSEDDVRNQDRKSRRLMNKIPKALKDKGIYEKFVDDVAKAVVLKMDRYFYNLR
jgi:hypothetical protein